MPGNGHRNLPPIAAMPDDDRTYLVKSYGALIRPSSAYSATPGLEVSIAPIDEPDRILDIHVNLTDITIVRLGTLWRRQRRVGVHEGAPDPRDGHLVYLDKVKVFGDTKKKLGKIGVSTRDKTFFIYEATLEEVGTGGIPVEVRVPCPELLVSTYMPNTLHLLYGLVMRPLDEVLSEEIRSYTEKTDPDGNCTLEVAFERTRQKSTRLFLAYVQCLPEVRERVSGVYQHLQTGWSKSPGGKTTASLKVWPWHPGRFEMTVSGLFDLEQSRLWVQRIEECPVPSECFVISELPMDPTENTSARDGSAVPVPAGEVPGDVPIDDEVDPGTESGRRHVTTEVTIPIPEGIMAEPRRRLATPKKKTIREGRTEAARVSSGKLTGQAHSEDVGLITYGATEKEVGEKAKDHFAVVLEAMEKIAGCRDLGVSYLTNDGTRNASRKFCTLEEKLGPGCGRTKWCLIGKRHRRLLVVEIVGGSGISYVVDIERKRPSEHFRGMIVWGRTIGPDELSALRKSLGRNQGKIVKGKGNPAQRGENTRCPPAPLPFDDFGTFVHDMDVDRMVDRILDAVKEECGARQKE